MEQPGNKRLFERYDRETEDGRLVTSQMDSLVAQHQVLAGTGAGAVCPRCKSWGVMFFGDPDGEHWCLACQILSDPEGLRS